MHREHGVSPHLQHPLCILPRAVVLPPQLAPHLNCAVQLLLRMGSNGKYVRLNYFNIVTYEVCRDEGRKSHLV
jgi:hypothetical protein